MPPCHEFFARRLQGRPVRPLFTNLGYGCLALFGCEVDYGRRSQLCHNQAVPGDRRCLTLLNQINHFINVLSQVIERPDATRLRLF